MRNTDLFECDNLLISLGFWHGFHKKNTPKTIDFLHYCDGFNPSLELFGGSGSFRYLEKIIISRWTQFCFAKY
jgi:hypothetical protein